MRIIKQKILILLILISIFWPKWANTQSVLLPSSEYLGFIQERVNSYLIYPKEAIANGWEGIVKVKFTLAPDGRLKEIDIAESSGYPLLDAAAILAIKDASPYPFPGNATELGELEMIVPVSYEQPKTLSQVSAESAPLSTPEKTLPLAEETRITPPSAQEAEVPTQEIIEQPQKLTQTPPPEPTQPQESQGITSPPELTYFLYLALQNNQPTKVAREEIELAQMKITEAQRNFFPALKILGYSTDGEVYNVEHEEREIKAQLDQPLYYSGRLKETFDQAKVNLEITQKNYDRLKFDVVHKTETAYYNLVASKMHLMQKQAVRQEAKEMLEKIEKLFALGMLIPLELNSAKSWSAQIEFQIESIQHELSMAELTFKQVLNIKKTPRTEAQLLELKALDLSLDNCLEVALTHRPEMYLSELMVKFNDYGKKIEKSKGGFTVDLTSSYGYYEGHYKTEPWMDSDNWYAGVKVSKPWGGSTINTSYTTEETQPRFGQTSATLSSTISGEFNLLDNMPRLSDKRKSQIELHRSLSDFDETLKTINFEVQDAFLKYDKAIYQLKTAESEMKFRSSEAEVMKIRAWVGETSFSNVLEALYGFSEAQSRYIQALANYYLSLASLKKACGYGLKT